MEAWPVTLDAPRFEWDRRPVCGQSNAEDQIQPYRTRTLPELEGTATLLADQTQWEAFKAWFDTTLNAGCEPWTADWLSDAGLTHHYARFRGGLYSARRRGIRWSITMELEIMADLVGSAYYVIDPYDPKNYGNIEMPEIDLSTSTSG